MGRIYIDQQRALAWNVSGHPEWNMLIKCICSNCAGHLEFEEENAGETIPCPHCGFKTTLAGPEWEKQKEESALLAKRRFIRGRLIWISGPLLVLGGIGFVLYHWGIPWLQDAFPSVDTTTKAVVVIIVACLIFPFVLFWLLFPLLLLFQMVKTNELLAKLVAAQSWDPEEDELDADEDDEEE